MPKFYDSISDDLANWAQKQQVFFTASAPLAGKHVNISPKGFPSSSFTIFSPKAAAYVDATGSGSETISHIYENARVTVMFCSFGATPRILRLFCIGRVVEWDTPEFETLLAKMGKKKVEGERAVICLDIFKVQTSCGYGVPKLSKTAPADPEKNPEAAFEDRETLGHWAGNKIEKNELRAYQVDNNTRSLDGLPGLKAARRDKGEAMLLEELKADFRRIITQKEALAVGVIVGMALILIAQVLILRK